MLYNYENVFNLVIKDRQNPNPTQTRSGRIEFQSNILPVYNFWFELDQNYLRFYRSDLDFKISDL